jgi:hypothetical protein
MSSDLGPGATAEALFFQALAESTVLCEQYAKYYAAGVAGLIALFTIVHWTRIVFTSTVPKSNPISRTFAIVSTPFRRQLKGFVAGTFLILPGRIIIAFTYFAINIACMFPQITYEYNAVFLAKRCGWYERALRLHPTTTDKIFRLALCNLCLTVFLALKNTPLSPLAGKSYESINVMHRCAGYTTIVTMLLHASVYIQSLVKGGSTFLLMLPGQYASVFAGFSLLAIGVTASSFFRKRSYEVFFVVHVSLVMGIMIARKLPCPL